MCRALESSGTLPPSIHSRAWAGENSGQISVTGTSNRRSSCSCTTPFASFGDRDRGVRDVATLLIVKISGVRTVERPRPRERHDTVCELEEVGVHLSITGREAPDHRDPRHLVWPCVGSHPG